MNTIGMIGLGVMGRKIAHNIIKGGFPMMVYDIFPEAMEELIQEGAVAAKSPEELGEKTKTVLMMVNSFDQCKTVMGHLLGTMREGTIINLGTIARVDAISLAEEAKKYGVKMLDCPVSGGSAGAKEGTLTIMASGETEVFQEHLPLFESFGKKIVHVGETPGDGQAVKSINQLLVGIHMCATAEAFTLARQCGLNLQLVYDTICSSAGMSRIFENRGEYLIQRNFDTRSTLQIQLKDTDIACKTADSVGAPLFLANTARELFKLAVKKYPPTDDSLEVVRLYEELCNAEIEE